MSEPKCNDKGVIVRKWETGDSECNAYSQEYECGAVYHNNFMDVVGNRDHDCFWNCSKCKREESEFMNPQAGRQFLMTGFLHT